LLSSSWPFTWHKPNRRRAVAAAILEIFIGVWLEKKSRD